MDELKPCPLCGGINLRTVEGGADGTHDSWMVYCNGPDCNCDSAWRLTEQIAVDAWNHRPGEAALSAQVATLQAQLDAARAALEGILPFVHEDFIENPNTPFGKVIKAALSAVGRE